MVAAALEDTKPDGLLCLGVCPDPFFRVELMAKNLALPSVDVAGERPPSDGRMRIVPDAPPAYWTGLPAEWLVERMEKGRVRLSARSTETHYSHTHLWPDAGFYLCNQIFYLAIQHLEGRAPHRGFVHVPRDTPLPAPDVPSREEILAGGAYLVGEFARWLSRHAPSA